MARLTSTVSGNVASFNSPGKVPINHLKVHFEPFQDLHGYANAWIGGTGANLLDLSKATLASSAYGLNISRNNDVFTVSGISTATGNLNFAIISSYADDSLSGKGYVCQAFNWTGTHNLYSCWGFRTESERALAIAVQNVTTGDTVNLSFKLSVSSTSQTAYSPYENICPITGKTNLNIEYSGKNLLKTGYYKKETEHASITCYEDGTIHVLSDGTDTGYLFLSLPDSFITNIVDGTYTLNPGLNLPTFKTGSVTVYMLINNQDIEFKIASRKSTTKTIKGGTAKLQVAVLKSEVVDVILKPQLQVGSIATDTELYQKNDIIPVTFPAFRSNLFNLLVPFQNPDNTVFTANGTKRIFAPNTFCVGISGNNYFEPNNVASYSIKNGVLTVTPYSMMYGVGFSIPVKSNTNYSVNFEGTNWRFECGFYKSDGTFIDFVYGGKNETFTTPTNCTMMTVVFNSYPAQSTATYKNIQVVESANSESYIDTVYGGYVDLITGEVVAEWEYRTIASLSSLWYYQTYNDANAFCFYLPNGHPEKGKGTYYWTRLKYNTKLLSTCYRSTGERKSGWSSYADYPEGTISLYGFKNLNTGEEQNTIVIKDSRYTSVNEFLNGVGNESICYQLETPVLLGVLSSNELLSVKGQNNVWSNDGSIEVDYDYAESIDILQTMQTMAICRQPQEKKVPIEYLRVEYVEGSGTQYIDTGIECTSDLVVRFGFSYKGNGNLAICGGIDTRRAPVYFRHHCTPDGGKFGYWLYNSDYSGAGLINPLAEANVKHDAFIDPVKGSAKFDGATFMFDPLDSGLSTTKSYGILGRIANNGTIQSKASRFYYFKFYRDNKLIGNFVPCIRILDNELGMYNFVDKQFYTNAGTGELFYLYPINENLYDGMVFLKDKTINNQTGEVQSGDYGVSDFIEVCELYEYTRSYRLYSVYCYDKNYNYLGVQSGVNDLNTSVINKFITGTKYIRTLVHTIYVNSTTGLIGQGGCWLKRTA